MTRQSKKRTRNKRIYTTAGALAVAALLGIAGIYEYQQSSDNKAQEEADATDTTDNSQVADTTNEDTDDTAEVSTAQIQNKNDSETTQDTTTDTATTDTSEDTVAASATTESSGFTAASTLSKPVTGDVLMSYSMDKTVFFETLNQYKYNPAVIFSANVNDTVTAATGGTVTDISTNEETGTTITMDLGNGYTDVYGQLKEVQVAVGDYVSEGALIGYISEPTKYYIKEGSNLYFKLELNNEPIDPMVYMN